MDILSVIIEKLRAFPNLVIEVAPGVVLAVLIFMIGRAIVRRLSTATVAASEKVATIDATLARFFGSVVLFAGTGAVIIASLSALNINLAFLATIIASLMIALGFALQDTLGDVASGVMLAVFRPFRVGDEVEIGGENGVVTRLGLFTTRMITRDNIELVIGNSAAFSNTIKNFHGFEVRRLDMDFGVSYDAHIGTAIEAILSAVDGDARILDAPEGPWAKVTELGSSAVVIQLRVWCDPEEHRHIRMDMSARVKAALDTAGVEIPYEHGVVIHRKVSQNAAG